jgi:hypothetical protein
MTSMRKLKRFLPAVLVVGIVLGAIPLVSIFGRDANSVASDTLGQTIGGLSQVKDYLQGKGASSQLTTTVDSALSNLQSALNSLSNGGNISTAEQALQDANNAFAQVENETGALNNETASQQVQYLADAISRAQSRAFEISNYTQQLGNSTIGGWLFANVTTATQLLSTASLQLQNGNITGAQASLQSALAILDQVNLALGSEQESEDLGEYQSEYQGRLGGAINQTISEIADIHSQLNSSSLSQAQKANVTSALDTASSLLSEASSKLSTGDTQGAWTSFNQAKLIVDQAQHLVKGNYEGGD